MGVRRAVDLARQASDCGQTARQAVYTLGPLIHNPRVLEELGSRGVQITDETNLPENLNGISVIIRAHGVGTKTEAELRERGGRVIDATCPRVKASQLKAAALASAGYRLFLAGEEHHAEIAGIKGYAEGNLGPVGSRCVVAADGFASSAKAAFCAVVGNAAEAEAAAARLHAEDIAANAVAYADAKTALIGQTTIAAEEYNAIAEALRKYFPDIEIAQTICPATEERQESLRELTETVEAVIIAGGKNSANTRRLLAVARAQGKPCALVESAAEIPPEFFRYETVGLAAGASTPDSVIDAIENRLTSAR
jgi:4-hydroxy-3-methylbut-2-enyl diphosphate reductase